MTKSIEMTGPNPAPTRRVALGLLGASVLGAGLVSGSARADNDEKVLTEALVLRDPEIPVIGNANGGITIDRLNGDLTAKAKEIDAILARNSAQAEAFEFRGTPSFIVGKFRVPGILTMAQFEQVIADARKAKASN